jgi:hypothetical protein
MIPPERVEALSDCCAQIRKGGVQRWDAAKREREANAFLRRVMLDARLGLQSESSKI